MPDNDDLRMNQNETLNCKLALMGVWTEACREAAAYFGVNPDGSGNFSSVTQAQAGSTAGTLAVDGISADEMTSRLAASLVEHFPDKTGIITGDPAAAKAYVKQYVVDLANHQALAQALRRRHGERAHAPSPQGLARRAHGLDISDETTAREATMFKTCSDPDFNWVHCLCDSATWVVKEPGKPIGFFYSRLFDDALSPSGLGFAVDAFRIDEDGTLDDFYSDILWDYGAADELIAAYPNKFSCAVRCDGLNPYDIPTSWSQDKGERYRARDTVLAAVDMLTDEADEAGIDACPEFYRNDYISMYLKTQGLGERVKVGGAEALRFSVVSTDCSCGDDEKGDFETLGEAMRAAKRLVDVEGYEGAAVYDRKQEAWCAGCNVATVMDMNGPASVTHPFWTITCEAEKREPAQRVAALERAQAIDRAKDAAARTARPSGAHYRPRRAQ